MKYILNQVHRVEGCAHLVSWNCFGSRIGMCVCVCVSVCPPPRALITSGVIYIVCDWLNKFHSFSLLLITYFIWHLLSIKWMGVAIWTQHVVNACQRLRWRVTTTKETPERRSASFIKVSGQMHSDAFKTRPAFSFTVVISA